MPPNQARPEDDTILAAVRALQSGAHGDAFEVIFRRFYRPLFLFFANRPALRDEADDLAQATLFRAYEKIHQYQSAASFEAWLRKIAENMWRNAVRERLAAKRGAFLEFQELPAEDSQDTSPSFLNGALSDTALNPEEAVLAAERRRMLRDAIESLPPGMRQCAELRLFADLKYREIAELTGIGLNSVRSQLFEARKRLKPVLDEHFQGADF
ncbi:MAG TPA: sigma-70 family RNA polymerase sigma factor [Thermoanaerobaculia bacterium]